MSVDKSKYCGDITAQQMRGIFMEVLIILVIIFLIYRVAFEVPKEIKKLEDKIDILKLHLQDST